MAEKVAMETSSLTVRLGCEINSNAQVKRRKLSTMRLCSLHHRTSLTSLVVRNNKTPYKVIPCDRVHIRVTTVSTIRDTSGCQTNTATKLQFSTAMDIIEFYWTLGMQQFVDSDVPSDTDGVLRYTSTLC